MQWDGSRMAGFTEGTPWLRLAADYATVNVATLSGQSDSVLSLYRTLIGLRNSNAALNTGRVEKRRPAMARFFAMTGSMGSNGLRSCSI